MPHEQKICPHDGYGCGREECRGGKCHAAEESARPVYSLVEDSHLRKFLKEEGYGFIAEGVVRVVPGAVHAVKFGVDIKPLNKGCDMPLEELERLWMQAVWDSAGKPRTGAVAGYAAYLMHKKKKEGKEA